MMAEDGRVWKLWLTLGMVVWCAGAAAQGSTEGMLVWAKSAGGSNVEVGKAVAVFPDGSVVVTGGFSAFTTTTATFGPGEAGAVTLTSAGFEDIFVAKYQADGTLTWAKRAGGTDQDESYGVAALPDGSAVVTGRFYRQATFGSGEPGQVTVSTLGLSATWNGFVAKYRADGTLAWVKSVPNAASTDCRGVTSLADGGVGVNGLFSGTTTFGLGEPGEVTLTSAGTGDVFIAKYREDGTLVWAKRAGGSGQDFPTGLSVSEDGTLVTGGAFSGSATFGPNEAGAVTLQSAGGQDTFVAKYHADGTLGWAKRAGGTGTEEQCQDVAVLGDGTVVATGLFMGVATFGAGEPGEVILTSAGSWEVFVARYDADGMLAWAKRAGGSLQDSAWGIELSTHGKALVTGGFMGTSTFGPGEATEVTLTSAAGSEDFFLACYDIDGTLAWVKHASSNQSDRGEDIAVLADGDFLVTGGFNGGVNSSGSATFGPGETGEVTLTSAGRGDIFVAKFAGAGTLVSRPIIVTNGGADFTTSESAITVEGTCGSETVEIRVNGATTGVTYTPGATTWSYSGTLSEGPNSFSVTALNAAQIESAPDTITITLDTVAPAVPVITTDGGNGPGADYATGQPALTLEGGCAGDAVTILVNDSNLGVSYVSGASTWSYSGDLSEGPNPYSVTAEDAAGNVSGADTITITLDTVPPSAPVITTNGGANFTTSNPNLTLDGTCASDTAQIRVNGSTVGVTYTAGATTWSYSGALAEGPNNSSVTAVDAVGNISAPGAITVTFDAPGPSAPVITTNGGADFTTNQASITLNGTCTADTVEIRVNGSASGATYTAGATTWSYTGTLGGGANLFTVIAYDGQNIASPGDTITVTLDDTAPIVSSVSPSSGSSLGGSSFNLEVTFSEAVTGVDASDVVLSGSAGASAVVGVVSDRGGNTWRFPITNFTYGALDLTLAPDANDIEDGAGNDLAPYALSYTIPTPVAVTEDFETGDFSRLPWTFSGYANWTITTGDKHGGAYGAKAGTISGGESTTLRVVLTTGAGDITFWRKVSSEAASDTLKFYVDGVARGTWSGEVVWNQVSYAVTAGSHTFSWIYSKDFLVSAGSDTAWIDDIQFANVIDLTPPAAPIITTNSGIDFTTSVSPVTLWGTCAADTNAILINGSATGVTYIAGATSWSYTGTLVEGANNLFVTALDTAGNVSSADTITVTLDSPGPSVPVIATNGGADFTTGQASITLNGTCTADTVEIRVNGSATGVSYTAGATTWSYSGTLSSGANLFAVIAYDVQSLASGAGTITVMLDDTAPIVSSTSPSDGSSVSGGSFNLDVTFSELVTGVDATDVALSGSAAASASVGAVSNLGGNTWRFPISGLVIGTLDIDLAPDGDDIEDAAGNDLAPETLSYTITPAPAAVEDFETGDFTRLPWTHGGNADWIIATQEKHTGTYSARAGTITHSQSATLQVIQTTGAGNVMFWRKVSSEAGYDKLTFYVDDVLQGTWSGSVDWDQAGYAVTAGTHTFTWTYAKDSVMSAGSDTAWIDDVQFPPVIPDTTPPAAPVITTNNGNDFVSNQLGVTLDGSCAADTDAIWVNDGSNGVTYTAGATSWSFTGALNQGPNVFSVVAVDASANVSTSDVITVTLDNIPPEVPVISTNNGADFSTEQILLILTGTCAADTAYIRVNDSATGVSYESGAGIWTYSGDLLEGANSFSVVAFDEVGNASDPATITVTRLQPSCVTAVYEVSPNAGSCAGGETVTITGLDFLEGVTRVWFGAAEVEAQYITFVDSNTLEVTHVPAAAIAGATEQQLTVNVSVQTCGDAAELFDAYTYGNLSVCGEPSDIDANGQVNAVDVQLVINSALGLSTGFDCDIDNNGDVDAVDVQLVINGALGIG
ncbi:MAG: IPT/TIG domain-containing protein [Candidatus Hydrogenedentes bacterium]|nr:IPT/TIG domain-containing protein [Candidatus Hydrogenedentota bacterium]